MPTHKLTFQVQSTGGGQSLSGVQSEVGTTEIILDQYFAASSVNAALAASFTVASIQDVYLYSDKGLTLRTNGPGTSEVQTISITGTPTGGSFPIAFGGAVTSVAYNASAANIQTALQTLSTIGSGNVTCTGGPLPGTPVVCTFAGTLANTNVAALTVSSVALTGGSSPTVSVAITTPGKPSDVITLKPGTPLVWSKSAGYTACPFTVDVTGFYISTTAAARIQGKILTS
jgi:hypothetical protein